MLFRSDCAACIQTSGTTGAPAWIMLGRQGAVAAERLHARSIGWHADGDRWLAALPFDHTGGLAVIVRCLVARQTVVLPAARHGAALATALSTHACTLASLVPNQLADLSAGDHDVGRLRAVLIGGAHAPDAQVTDARRRGLPVVTSYGMTECWGQVASSWASPGRLRPLPGVTLTAGASANLPQPICVASPAMMIGVVGQPAHHGRLHTRDLGWINDDGDLTVVGRTDLAIVTGGHKVQPELLEARLGRDHAVWEVCVVGVADPQWGQRFMRWWSGDKQKLHPD